MSEDYNNGGFFNGDGFWGVIVLFFIFAMFGGGGFGWGGGGNALQGALTRGELADGFNTAEILRNQSGIVRDNFGMQRDVLENRYAAQLGMSGLDKSIMENRFAQQSCCCETQKEIMQNRYDNALGNQSTQREIMENRYNTQLGLQNLQARQDSCCCDLKTAIHAEAEATRALITQNTVQELRDSLQAAQLQLGNLSQTQTLLAAIDKVPQPAYITCSPYQSWNAQGACRQCG